MIEITNIGAIVATGIAAIIAFGTWYIASYIKKHHRLPF